MDETKTIRIGWVIAVVFLMAFVIVMSPSVRAKMARYEASESEIDNFIQEDRKVGETGQIREDSGMPCINPEQFRRWYADYSASTEGDGNEQETSEEAEIQSDGKTSEESETSETACDETAVLPGMGESLPEETVSEDRVVYTVNGETLNPDIQAYLYQRLADHNIEWFMPYAVMVAYQESHFDCTAVNQSNGIDCGLFQFRAPYYEGQDIFNPYEQIDIFTEQMANRANAGLDVYEMISRHNVSDYGTYNNEYVMQVMKHETNLREVSNEERNDQD